MKSKPLDLGTLKLSVEMGMLKITGNILTGKSDAKRIGKFIEKNLKEIRK